MGLRLAEIGDCNVSLPRRFVVWRLIYRKIAGLETAAPNSAPTRGSRSSGTLRRGPCAEFNSPVGNGEARLLNGESQGRQLMIV